MFIRFQAIRFSPFSLYASGSRLEGFGSYFWKLEEEKNLIFTLFYRNDFEKKWPKWLKKAIFDLFFEFLKRLLVERSGTSDRFRNPTSSAFIICNFYPKMLPTSGDRSKFMVADLVFVGENF